MRSLRRIGPIVALLLLPYASSGQVVASVRHFRPESFTSQPAAPEWVAVDKTPVELELKAGLKTGPKGWMAIWYENRKQDEVGNNSEVQLVKSYGGYVLRKGTILANSPAESTGGQGQAKAETTSFVMTYDPITDIAEVVGVSGRTEVRNVVVGGRVYVEAREISRVEKGRPPTEPHRLEDAEYQRYLRPFEVGGAETAVEDNPLITGASVPTPGEQPVSEAIPGAETASERAGRPADLFKQPFPGTADTDLGIDFEGDRSPQPGADAAPADVYRRGKGK
jgi:hypothetical protein